MEALLETYRPQSFDQWVVLAAATLWLAAAATVAISLIQAPSLISTDVRPTPHWLSKTPQKRYTELSFLIAAPFWIGFMGYIISTGWYEDFKRNEYLIVCLIIVLPTLIVPPLLFASLPNDVTFASAVPHYIKAHLWLGILTFVGSYFWTHYFYSLLQATYTFDAHKLNGVPISMYFAAHAYFTLYHTLTNMCLRRWYTSAAYASLRVSSTPYAALLGSSLVVASMAWVTAAMEAFTIQGFPYYHIPDRSHMYTVGSIVYGFYFCVSFPLYYRIDTTLEGNDAPERKGEELGDQRDVQDWSLGRTALEALGGCMLVTILLDIYRIAFLSSTEGMDININTTNGLAFAHTH